jgi:glycosyltransferase involved in cell wall biosynthesis
MIKKKAIFLTNKESLYSEITGGVQLCSQEFHGLIGKIEELEVADYYVKFTRRITDRIFIRLRFENYNMYDVRKDTKGLLKYIEDSKIEVVFINMASLTGYAEVIKQKFGENVKIVLLSHGNHSGDFLHLISKPIDHPKRLKSFLRKVRLGLLVSKESLFRVKYLDSVITLSETEKQIENWFGSIKSIFVPRQLAPKFINYKPTKGRIGFVGRLDHPPNLQGIQILLDAFKSLGSEEVEFRLVGAPFNYGASIKENYPFVSYLGELSDKELEEEVSSWTVFINPVWWYSTGASTKLAKAISWGIPIITTTAGMRGYFWKEGELITADTPEEMAKLLIDVSHDLDQVAKCEQNTKRVAQSGLTISELTDLIRSSY